MTEGTPNALIVPRAIVNVVWIVSASLLGLVIVSSMPTPSPRQLPAQGRCLKELSPFGPLRAVEACCRHATPVNNGRWGFGAQYQLCYRLDNARSKKEEDDRAHADLNDVGIVQSELGPRP